MNKNKIIAISSIVLGILVILSVFIFANRKKSTLPTTNTKETTTAKTETTELTLSESEKPIISLVPREDGHQLTLKITNLPPTTTSIDYELIYSSTENGLTMEKGVGDTIKEISPSIEKDLLLGTASCTNGCKYKYDEGVNSGTLSITFYTSNNQSAVYESPFVLITSADIKKDGGFKLKEDTDNFSVKATTTTKSDYFVVIKNYPSYYSVFSNGTGTGKVTSINPNTITKTNMASLVGDYQTK